MKNNQFKQLNKIIKSRKSHTGFTLIELLSGLIMSTIVVAGLGLGLYQLTKITRDEGNKITARNDSLRAREFITDELRRARTIIDLAGFTAPTGSFPTGGTVRLALDIPELSPTPVIYSVAPANSNWQGDLVIYRWGPSFNQDGTYGTGAWSIKPLVDGLSDSTQNIDCNGTSESYQGFYACRINDITAQLYFTSDIETNTGSDTIYTANTQVVARARTRNTDASQALATNPIYFRTLGADYHLHTMANAESSDPLVKAVCNGETTWTMRTDFMNGDEITTWIHDPDRQGQQIDIDTTKNFQIASIPIGNNSCTGTAPISRGNPTLTKQDNVYTAPSTSGDPWTYDDTTVELSEFTIAFDTNVTDYYKTFNGNTTDFPDSTTNSTLYNFNQNLPDDEKDYHSDNWDTPDIPGIDHVKVFKKGSIISLDSVNEGYDDNSGDNFDAEDSLGKFLYEKGYAIKYGGNYKLVTSYEADNLSSIGAVVFDVNGDGSADKDDLNVLKNTERIIAVEIGQVENGTTIGGNPNPGYDLQDSVFILSTDKFAGKHP